MNNKITKVGCIDPSISGQDRIDPLLSEERKYMMQSTMLSPEIHNLYLADLKSDTYRGKTKAASPVFLIVLSQTGGGKSHLSNLEYNNYGGNIVRINSDQYKLVGRTKNSLFQQYKDIRYNMAQNTSAISDEKLYHDFLVDYAFLTACDAYLYRDEIVVDSINKGYNILMECAPSKKEKMFIDIDELRKAGYRVRVSVMSASWINSALSIHERYEDEIEKVESAKLTSLDRHNDSFDSLLQCVKIAQEKGAEISIYSRGDKNSLYVPQRIYTTGDVNFPNATEALLYSQKCDEKRTIAGFKKRYLILKARMTQREAPKRQIAQLEKVEEQYLKLIEENEKDI